MIIQGANNPLTIQFSESVEGFDSLVVTLWRENQLVKKWEKSDMAIDGDTAVCQLTEDETAGLVSSPHIVEAKGLDDGVTVFWDKYVIPVLFRHDRVIKLTQAG